MLYNHCTSNFLKYIISSFQVNKDGLKLNGTYLLLPYADDVIIWTEA